MGGWGLDYIYDEAQVSSSCLDVSYEHARACSDQSPMRILPLSYFILQPNGGYNSNLVQVCGSGLKQNYNFYGKK